MTADKPFDQGSVVKTRDLGFEEDYTVHVERSYEGGWTANCPECGLAEFGETREEAIQHLVENLRLQHKQLFKI